MALWRDSHLRKVCPYSSPLRQFTINVRCQEYQTHCPISGYSSGIPYVAGGSPVGSKEFPHMAAIGYGDESDIKWHCGGTIISEKFVLTAAHCDNSPSIGPAKWVLLGAVALINTTATDGNNGQIHPIIRRIRHPEYKPPAKYNDIALFEIGPAVTPNPRSLSGEDDIRPACLSLNRNFTSSKAIATGWGRVGFADDGSSNLLKVTLNVFELSVCQDAYESEARTSLLRNGIVPTMLCAGVLEGKRDTCQGDSGGPLQIPLDGRRCIYEVWGVTSFGKVCAFPNSPSVYSKVLEYVPWIEDIVWPT
ncbi:hypothetical protein J437_LFUL011097 [Ladona fulva]|uniref:Peptidase S1 domain-containing protein n=1 Tax=Ladona fulva TaxID=123851 RepID=A0A8K0KIF4_LADFU|nr:hypothetical protein J437_LFUL011097 [Ladona fulva]